MVSTTTTMVSHAQEGDKKRKQTLERAKAHHLCRQLQMRLQYARLKVEHGWQKQTLNEVENLYFHHSHQRGPKPFPSSLVATTTQPEPTGFAPSSGPHSSLSFISRNTGPIAAPDAASHGRDTTPQPGNRSSPTRSASVTPKPYDSAAQMPPPSTTPAPMAVDKGNPPSTRHAVPLTPISPQRQPLLLSALQSIGAPTSPLPQLPYTGYASTSTTPRPSSSVGDTTLPPPLPATLRSPSSPSKPRPRGGKSKASNTNGNGASSTLQKNTSASSTSISTQGASSSSSISGYVVPKDAAAVFTFGSSSSSLSASGLMTYDAFWSNHTTTTASPRNTASTVGLQSRMLNGMGGGGGLGGVIAMAGAAATGAAGSSEVGQQ